MQTEAHEFLDPGILTCVKRPQCPPEAIREEPHRIAYLRVHADGVRIEEFGDFP